MSKSIISSPDEGYFALLGPIYVSSLYPEKKIVVQLLGVLAAGRV